MKGGDLDLLFTIKNKIFDTCVGSNGRMTVKPGWTSKLNLFVWEKLHLPCCFSFIRSRYRTEDIFVEGKCTHYQCKAQINTYLRHGSKQIRLVIKKYKVGTFHDPKKKRRTLPDEKKVLVENLKSKSAYALRNELADQAMSADDPDPSHVPTAGALRVMRSKAQCQSSGNTILALHELKKRFVNCIQNIALDPFYAFFSSETQRRWYKLETEYNKRRAVISIDATGLGLRPPMDNKKYIFLYVICAHGTFNEFQQHYESTHLFFCVLIMPAANIAHSL